jgi:hypothetical protein
MSLTTLAIQEIVRTGLTPVLAAANTDGSYVPNDGRVFLEVKCTNAAARSAIIDTPGVVDGLAIADLTVVVPLTVGDKMIGPFPPGVYNQSDGTIKVTFSAVDGVTIGAFRL